MNRMVTYRGNTVDRRDIFLSGAEEATGFEDTSGRAFWQMLQHGTVGTRTESLR
jgi:hypothetical protein